MGSGKTAKRRDLSPSNHLLLSSSFVIRWVQLVVVLVASIVRDEILHQQVNLSEDVSLAWIICGGGGTVDDPLPLIVGDHRRSIRFFLLDRWRGDWVPQIRLDC